MSDDDNQPDSPDGIRAFGIELPGALLGRLGQDHDRHHMRWLDSRNRVNDFLDGLDEEQLRTLKFILEGDKPVDVYGYNQKIVGQVDAILRIKLNVDPDERTPDTIPDNLE